MRIIFSLSLLLSLGITASAQTFDVTVSASLPFTAAGPSSEALSAAIEAGARWEGWNVHARVDLGLMPLKLSMVTLTSSTTFYGVSIHDVAVIDFQNPVQETLTLGAKVDQFQLSAIFTYSYPLVEFWKITFGDVTVGAVVTSAEGIKLSSATTMTLQGFSKQVLGVGLSLQGMSISRTTELTQAGIAVETWEMALNVWGFSILRTTVYAADGFASDTLNVGKQFGDFAFVGETVFDKTGWASKTLTLSTVYQQLNLSTTLIITPAGFKGGSLDLSKTMSGITIGNSSSP